MVKAQRSSALSWRTILLLNRNTCFASPKRLYSNENQEVCNGANIYKEGKDPVIKPDSEYPEWLKTLKTEVTPLEQLSVDDKSYWRRMRKAKIKQQNAMRKQGILK